MHYVEQLLRRKDLYEKFGKALNGIPWQFIGVVHCMEAGFDITKHLHNGDPLAARTVRVPAGRPATGAPPFRWEDSTTDALVGRGLHQVGSWSVARVLYELERYNGMGYRRMGKATPYLWSFSNLYEKGRHVRDHEYDPEAVSKQCGAALMIKTLVDQGETI